MLQFFGIASGILITVSSVPYIIDILKKKTKPERASWFIWLVLSSIAFFSQLAEGADWSLILTGADAFAIACIFLLSLQRGSGGFTKKDIFALAASAVGLCLWYFTQHAYYAIFITLLIDMTATVLTVIKTYEDYTSETMSMWLLDAIAGILSTISVGEMNFILLIYPFCFFLFNLAVVIAILLGKRKKK